MNASATVDATTPVKARTCFCTRCGRAVQLGVGDRLNLKTLCLFCSWGSK